MNEHAFNPCYGVDPATPQDKRELRDLVRLFGLSEGRFIAEYPVDLWRKAFLQHAKAKGDDHYHLAVEVLRRLAHALLVESRYTEWVQNRSWAENAMSVKSRCDWEELIGPPGSPPTVKIFQDLLDQFQPLPVSRGALIPMNARAYAKAAKPLLLTSPKVILVDKFFHSEEKWHLRRNIVIAFLEAARAGSRLRFFEVRNGLQGPALARFKEALDACNEEAGTANRVEMAVLPIGAEEIASSPGITSHARYLLGNSGGLRFDHGFVENRSRSGKPVLNDVHWLSMPVWDALWRHYG